MKFKNLFPIFILFLLLTNCKKEATTDLPQTIDFNKFTLNTPADWERFYPSFTDGFFGGLTDGRDTLYFDYGPESFRSIDEVVKNEDDISFSEHQINGHDGKIVKEKREEEFRVRFSLYVDTRDGENHNRIYGYGIEQETIVRAIFLSHRFQ